jgi:hypothetical protein
MLNVVLLLHTKNYLSDKYNKESVMKNVRKSLLGVPALYLAGAFMGWASVYISFVIYALISIVFIVPVDKDDTRPSQ